MINTETDKMRKCDACVAGGQKSRVSPYRKFNDPSYDAVGEFILQQHDIYWDEEGTPHSHVMYACNKGHLFRGECESCAWGKEQDKDLQVVPLPVSDSAVPAPPVMKPPAPVLAPVASAPQNDLVLQAPKARK